VSVGKRGAGGFHELFIFELRCGLLWRDLIANSARGGVRHFSESVDS
jgi:hypothetical protein